MLPGAGAAPAPAARAAPAAGRRRAVAVVLPSARGRGGGRRSLLTAGGTGAAGCDRPRTRTASCSPGSRSTADRFAVGYRNSVYGTLAEERYRVHPDGRFELVELAAEQVAVLEEYYQVPGAPPPAPAGDRLDFVVAPDPARPPSSTTSTSPPPTSASARSTCPGHAPVPVWQRVVSDDPTVILDIEENP